MPTQRELQAEILSREDCAALRITPDTPKVDGATAYQQDKAIADILNAAGFGIGMQDVEAWKAKRYLIKRGKWRAIVEAADNLAHPARPAEQVAVDLAESPNMMANFLDPEATAMWGALGASGLVNTAERDEIQSWCRTPSTITASQVSSALRGPWW